MRAFVAYDLSSHSGYHPAQRPEETFYFHNIALTTYKMAFRSLCSNAFSPLIRQSIARSPINPASRPLASITSVPPISSISRNHKIVIVGRGTAGITITNQLLRSGSFTPKDIALTDPATWHHYQPGWTLVGGGLKNKTDLRKRLQDTIDPKARFYNEKVRKFELYIE
jgi:hypothetical protein